MNKDFGKYQKLVNAWAKRNDMVFVLPKFIDLFTEIEKQALTEKHLALIPKDCVIVSKVAFEYQKKIGAKGAYQKVKHFAGTGMSYYEIVDFIEKCLKGLI